MLSSQFQSKILIVAAHPDDEILGAGGTWHRREKGFGDKIETLIFSKGRGTQIDQKFDTLPLTYFVRQIEDAIVDFKPEIVFTQSIHDLNLDHKVICEATKVACRPTRSGVKGLYAYDSSLTPFDEFKPNYFVFLTEDDIKWKVEQMKEKYPDEMNLPYRDEDGIYTQAKFWGDQIGKDYAEAFETLFEIV